MYHFTFYRKMAVIICLLLSGLSFSVHAQDACSVTERGCILDELIENTAQIENTSWRDQTYREIAKTLAFDNDFDKALNVIDMVQTPDIKAMSIRGVGMMLGNYEEPQEEITKKFAKLRIKADSISSHPPSHGIALTYIAMAQAFAGDNAGAWKTSEDMKNSALRNKAYGETAEIQAERGDFKSAKISIEKITSLSFRNKAYELVSKILSDKGLFQDAYDAAKMIDNNYKRGQAIQYMLDTQQPRDRVQ